MSEENNCNGQCSGCSSASTCGQKNDPSSMLVPPHKLSNIKHVIGIVSGKGGVGKSMVTGLMATSFRRKNLNVGILDADITGPSIPKMFGVEGHELSGDADGAYPAVSKNNIHMVSINLLVENPEDPVVWRGPVIGGVVKQFWQDIIWKDIDYMFIDMPPGTGDVPLTVFQSIKVDGIIVVTSPQELVSMIVAKAVKMAEIMQVPVLGLVENMSYFMCPNCQEKHKIYGESHIEDIAKKYNLDVLAQIPIEPKLAALCDAGAIEDFEGNWLDNAVEKILKNK